MQIEDIYIRGSGILRFWYLWGVLEPSPQGYQGTSRIPRHYCGHNGNCDLKAAVKSTGFVVLSARHHEIHSFANSYSWDICSGGSTVPRLRAKALKSSFLSANVGLVAY